MQKVSVERYTKNFTSGLINANPMPYRILQVNAVKTAVRVVLPLYKQAKSPKI
jgi:hypothetical protein